MPDLLIIDDEPWSRQVVRKLGQWERHGLNVIGEAEDGREGIRRIEEWKPHIVLTDMRMPGLDGIELLKAMNERFPRLKIIVMSGYDDFAYLKQAILSRAIDYLLKPIDPDELNAALASCVKQLEQDQLADSARQAAASAGGNTVFADPALLERYLEIRRQVYGHLLELDEASLPETFRKLEQLLHQDDLQQDGGIPARIGHDFIHMLEEFSFGMEDGMQQVGVRIRGGIEVGSWRTVREAIQGVASLSIAAIREIAAYRRNRSRLNLEEVRAHIDRHYLDPISLETVARHFFVSKEHLSRAFKAEFRENLSDYILRRRMDKARELIAEQGLAIKHAARMTGYADLAYFYRVFKKYYGINPGDLRRGE